MGGLLFGPLAGIPAIITGHIALGRIKKSGVALQGHGKAIAGLVLGYMFTAMFFVIALLASVGFTAANSALTKAHKVRTLATAAAIESAVNNYLMEYGAMPSKSTSDTTLLTSTDTDLLHVLLALEADLNTKSIRFLSVREGAENKDGLMYAQDGLRVVGLFDSWGGGYHVRLDLDSDGKIDACGEVLDHRRVAVWSDGPDRKPCTEDDVKTW